MGVAVLTAVARLIVRHYSPVIPADPAIATWEAVMAELAGKSQLRARSAEVYVSILAVFRSFVPGGVGPADVTVDVAKSFAVRYAKTPFKKAARADGPTYTRTPKTVENAIRKLSALWSKMMPKYVAANPWLQVTRPTVPKRPPVIPTERDVSDFYAWLEKKYPGWKLARLFVEVKALSGCRLRDLCEVRSSQLDTETNTLTILASQNKTHCERCMPLPPDVVLSLWAISGKTYLWEQYLADSRTRRPGSKNMSIGEFDPGLMYNAMKSIFRAFKATGGKLKSHGLRKRAITLTVLSTQSVDQTAAAIGIDPATARKYYLDANLAFDGKKLLEKMAGVLRPSH